MKSITHRFILVGVVATLSAFSSRAETLGELLRRFDTNGDRQLDAREFAEAQKAVGPVCPR